MISSRSNAVCIDLGERPLRDVNALLQSMNGIGENGFFRLMNPNGLHAIACGLDASIEVEVEGHAGYYCAGMNKMARVRVVGNAGQGVAENMMSGLVRVDGDVSQCAGATAHGGLLVVNGNAAARCGISLKGGDIVVKGNVGHMSMFMAQAGRLVVLGNAGDGLGDSIYEAQIFVRGQVGALGADCVEKQLDASHLSELSELLNRSGCNGVDASEFRRFGSARRLYNFDAENLDDY